MLQVVAFIGLHEGASSQGLFDLWLGNTDKREPGDLGFDPLKLMPNTKEAADLMRLKELKNGRMAMIAVAGFAANHFIPGSVPGLTPFLKHYDGNVMVPFASGADFAPSFPF